MQNQTPEDIKSFTDAHPDLEYFLDWGGCIEWQAVHAGEEARQHYERWFAKIPDYRTELLNETLSQFPPVMHYIGNRHKTEVTK